MCLIMNRAVMSADDGKNVVMKGVTHGACDYLIKPIRMEALKNIWQHVVRKRKNECKDLEQSGSVEEVRGDRQQKQPEDADFSSSANDGSWKKSKRREDEEEEAEERDDASALKKPRVVWSVELHQQFVAAVNQLGIDSKYPNHISQFAKTALLPILHAPKSCTSCLECKISEIIALLCSDCLITIACTSYSIYSRYKCNVF